jgi:tetratricopeptide (TPR) repeat protein
MTTVTNHHRGLELARTGHLDEAEAIFRRILDADPTDAEALHFFGVLLARQNQPAEAERHLRQALAARPGWAKAWNSLGAVLQGQGRLEAALAACEGAVRFDPQWIEALFNLGVVLHSLGRLPEAADALRKAVGAEPEFADAFSNLAAVFTDMSLDGESEAAALRAIELEPDHAGAHNNLGNALRRLGRSVEAKAAYRRATELAPRTGLFHGNLANMLRARGELAEAEAEHRCAVDLDPTHTVSYRMLAESKSIEAGDPLFARMVEQLGSDATAPAGKIDLHFALATVFENQEDYDRAFGHWKVGNRLKRSSIDYDDAAREAAIQNIMDVFNEELLGRYAGQGSDSEAPIFVLGMPRSGTTLVEQILASHSQVEAGGELTVLRRLARQARYPEAFANSEPVNLKGLGESYLAAARPLGGPHFTDKTPENFLHIGLIRLALPNARIIHCRRDPVDTCLSCYRCLFVRGRQGFAYDLRELGLEYLRYARLMAHWRMVAPGNIHELQYEDLIADQEGETRRLLAFCGLPFEDACLRFDETERMVETASAYQVRQKIYRGAAERWKHYEKHLGPLLEVLRPNGLP